MKYGPFLFTVITHKDREFYHLLEVGPFSYEFIFYSIPGPFLRADKELGRSRELVDLFKSKIVKFNCVNFHVQEDGDYPLGIDEPPQCN